MPEDCSKDSNTDSPAIAQRNGSHKLLLDLLPVHLLDYLFDFFPQETTVALLYTNKTLRQFARSKLYRRIYLSDAIMAQSSVYNVGRLWSVLKADFSQGGQKPSTASNVVNDNNSSSSNNDNANDSDNDTTQYNPNVVSGKNNDELFSVADGDKLVLQTLNLKLRSLISTLKNNADLCNLVKEIWIDQDLDFTLQQELVYWLMNNSPSIRFINSVLNNELMYTIQSGKYINNLQSLDIAPPNLLSSMVSNEYLQKVRTIITKNIDERNYKMHTLSLFADPIKLFNGMKYVKSDFADLKLKVTSLNYHIRDDKFNFSHISEIDQEERITKLNEIMDPCYLRSLTIICWLVIDTPAVAARTFLRNIWEGFKNLQEISFVSMIVKEELIAEFLQHFANKLKRFRFHYALPRYHLINNSSLLTRALIKYQSKSLEFIDINFHDDEHEFYWYNVFDSKVEFHTEEVLEDGEENNGCFCADCKYTKKTIITDKLFHGELSDVSQEDFNTKSIISLIFRRGLIPYTFSFDKYPSFVSIYKIQQFLKEFNSNCDCNLKFSDFRLIYQTLLHHMEPTLNFFIKKFPNLNRLVINDIPFIVLHQKALPVFTFSC